MAKAHEPPSPAPTTDQEHLQRFFQSAMEDIDAFLTEEAEEKRDELREVLQPLCIMKRILYTIQLAWGGPEYGFKLTCDPESKEWISGVFYWADWFKYTEESLSPNELTKVVDAYSMECLVE